MGTSWDINHAHLVNWFVSFHTKRVLQFWTNAENGIHWFASIMLIQCCIHICTSIRYSVEKILQQRRTANWLEFSNKKGQWGARSTNGMSKSPNTQSLVQVQLLIRIVRGPTANPPMPCANTRRGETATTTRERLLVLDFYPPCKTSCSLPTCSMTKQSISTLPIYSHDHRNSTQVYPARQDDLLASTHFVVVDRRPAARSSPDLDGNACLLLTPATFDPLLFFHILPILHS